MFAYLLSFLGIEEQLAIVVDNDIQPLLDLDIHFETALPRAISGSCRVCGNAVHMHSNAF